MPKRYQIRKRPSGVIVAYSNTGYGAHQLAEGLKRGILERRLEVARAERELERRRALEGGSLDSDDDVPIEQLERRLAHARRLADTETHALDVYRKGRLVDTIAVGDAEPQLPRPPTPPRSLWEQLSL